MASCEQHTITGRPDAGHISTSYIERNNLTLRMQNKRFARLTNVHIKKLENHCHALALHFVFYNFARKKRSAAGQDHRDGGGRVRPHLEHRGHRRAH